MTENHYAENVRAFRINETCAASELLEDITIRLDREISDMNKLRSIDMTEYAAMVNAYVQAVRLYLDILKEGAESE